MSHELVDRIEAPRPILKRKTGGWIATTGLDLLCLQQAMMLLQQMDIKVVFVIVSTRHYFEASYSQLHVISCHTHARDAEGCTNNYSRHKFVFSRTKQPLHKTGLFVWLSVATMSLRHETRMPLRLSFVDSSSHVSTSILERYLIRLSIIPPTFIVLSTRVLSIF